MCIRDRYYIFDDGPYIGQEHGPIWEEMHELFYTPANIPDSQIHCVTEDNWDTYDEEIRNGGGLDVMVIGLGSVSYTHLDVYKRQDTI